MLLQDEEAHRRNYQRQIEDLTTKVKRTEEALRSATTDYILARRDKQAAETRAVAAEEALQLQKESAQHEVCYRAGFSNG
jgi:coiled-coil domain-containing protein 77